MRRKTIPGSTTLLASLLLAGAALFPAQAQELRIGLQDDADVLDPDQSRTFVGRIVYTALCDKLVDITPELEIIPQLATAWSWNDEGTKLTMSLREGVVFHDGTPFDAEAVKANIERSKTLPESRRKSELSSVDSVEVTGSHEVEISLTGPDATLLAQFADRSGMMLSPTSAEAKGVEFGLEPVCSGPFSFVERVQQDRIVLAKFEDYWNADAIHVDRVVYLPIPDGTVRLANLRAGDLHMLERLAAPDLASVKADEALATAQAVSLGYDGVTINVGNGERAKAPFGQDKRLRQAFELSIDRDALNQVVFEGAFMPGNQPFPPTSPWYDKDAPIPPRDVEAANALLADAGVERLELELQVANNPEEMQIAQVIQSMVSESGFDVKITAKEFASMLQDQSAGLYDASQVGWSGRVDPDGNIHQFMTCKGGINDSKYCNEEIDRLLDEARTSNDQAARKEAYDAARKILSEDLPIIYLYHQTWIWAMTSKLEGFTPYPDGMIRLENVKLGS